MREILFIGKRKDNGKWIQGDLRRWKNSVGIHNDILHRTIKVDPETVGQFTGLYDKNGIRIFEGDIVRGTDCLVEGFEVRGYIDHRHGSFVIVGDPIVHYRWRDYCVEVIGNKHDNPELLGGSTDE